jgi:hypothetical protein
MIVQYTLYPENVKSVDGYAFSLGASARAYDSVREDPPRGKRLVDMGLRIVRSYEIAAEDAPALDAFVIALAKARRVDAL